MSDKNQYKIFFYPITCWLVFNSVEPSGRFKEKLEQHAFLYSMYKLQNYKRCSHLRQYLVF